jgi:hypothetical protein
MMIVDIGTLRNRGFGKEGCHEPEYSIHNRYLG